VSAFGFEAVVDRIDCTVIGAGVIGLAVARALALAGREVIVIEAANSIGTETSSRNSEVIHAGIYYPTGSLKARLCVKGRERLYAYAVERAIGHERLGKLIVATGEGQLAKLHQIKAAAAACGVDDLVLLDQAAAQRLEPELACVAALHSPSTGIIDSHALMLSLEGDAEAKGALFAFETKIQGGEITSDGIVLHALTSDGKSYEFLSNKVVNAAGLGAQDVAAKLAGFPQTHIPPLTFARGCYFTLSGKAPFSRLVYPVPVDGGLGVHLTLDLAKQARFGPDVEWIDRIDYTFDDNAADRSTARSAGTGRPLPMAACSRAIPASARNCRDQANPPPISSSQALAIMELPASSISSASKARASPRVSRLRMKSRASSIQFELTDSLVLAR
jgi:L-2-hydroxyglutarate oxidase LhgO